MCKNQAKLDKIRQIWYLFLDKILALVPDICFLKELNTKLYPLFPLTLKIS